MQALFERRAATVFRILASVGAVYLVAKAPSIMDFAQAVFRFVNAPLLGTLLLGMFWKRTTPWSAFFGLLLGTRTIVAFTVGAAATLLVSLFTTPRPASDAHLPWFERPVILAAVVIVCVIVLNVLIW